MTTVYKVLFTSKGRKTLMDFELPQRQRIMRYVDKLDFPFPVNFDIKKLSAEKAHYRLRVGDIRVLMEIDHGKKIIWVLKIGYRGNVY